MVASLKLYCYVQDHHIHCTFAYRFLVKMKEITSQQVSELLSILRGATSADKTDHCAAKHDVGSVWFGDWFHRPHTERFGSEKKPDHNATISRRTPDGQRFTMAPITTQKHSKDAILIPRGVIPGARKFENSYLLAKIYLRASRYALDNYFEYRCNLPHFIVQQLAALSVKGSM